MITRRAVEAGHAAQARIAQRFNCRVAALIRRAWQAGAERDADVAVWLNIEGHRSFRGLEFTTENLWRIRRATCTGYAPRRFRHPRGSSSRAGAADAEAVR